MLQSVLEDLRARTLASELTMPLETTLTSAALNKSSQQRVECVQALCDFNAQPTGLSFSALFDSALARYPPPLKLEDLAERLRSRLLKLVRDDRRGSQASESRHSRATSMAGSCKELLGSNSFTPAQRSLVNNAERRRATNVDLAMVQNGIVHMLEKHRSTVESENERLRDESARIDHERQASGASSRSKSSKRTLAGGTLAQLSVRSVELLTPQQLHRVARAALRSNTTAIDRLLANCDPKQAYAFYVLSEFGRLDSYKAHLGARSLLGVYDAGWSVPCPRRRPCGPSTRPTLCDTS